MVGEVADSEEDLVVVVVVEVEDEEDAADRLVEDLAAVAAEEGIATGITSTFTALENAPAPFRPLPAEAARLPTARGPLRPRPNDAAAVEVAAVDAAVSTTTGSAALVTTATAAAREAGVVPIAKVTAHTRSGYCYDESIPALGLCLQEAFSDGTKDRYLGI